MKVIYNGFFFSQKELSVVYRKMDVIGYNYIKLILEMFFKIQDFEYFFFLGLFLLIIINYMGFI